MRVWHEQRGNDTLCMIVHGHASHGGKAHHEALAEGLGWFGLDTLRYQGERECVGGILRAPTLTEDVAELRTALAGIGKRYRTIVAVAHSTGATVALAAQERFARFALLCPTISLPRASSAYLRLLNAQRGSAALLRGIPYRRDENEPHHLYTEAFFADFARYDTRALLATQRKPVLFVSGRSDGLIAPSGDVQLAYDDYLGPKRYMELPIAHRFTVADAPSIVHAIGQWIRT